MCSRRTNEEDALRKHPVRAAVLAALAEDEREMRPSQIRAELPGEPDLATVAYHLKKLERAGLVDREGDRYRLSERPDVRPERRRQGVTGDQGPSTAEA